MFETAVREVVIDSINGECFKRRFDRFSVANRHSMEWNYRPAENVQETAMAAMQTSARTRPHMNAMLGKD